MAVVEVSGGWYVDPKEIEDPKCVRANQFEAKTFHDFMLPRLESARDEASVEVLENFRRGRGLGDAIFDAIESLPASKTKRLRALVDLAKGTHIYAYVKFRGSHLFYGLVRTAGGPKDEIIDYKEVGGWEISESAPYWEFYDAYKAIDKVLEHESRRTERERIASLFEENPMVEVREEGDYEDALKVMGLPQNGGWKKPGLYDFRDSPPSYSGSAKDLEREILKEEAERALQDMWDSETWESACEILVERANR